MEGFIRSPTAIDIFRPEGDVPETISMGDTAEVSIIEYHAWYDWIKFYEEKISGMVTGTGY